MDDQFFQLIVVIIFGGIVGLVADKLFGEIPNSRISIVVLGIAFVIIGFLLEINAYHWWSFWLVPFGLVFAIIGLIGIIWRRDASRYWLIAPVLIAMVIIVFWMEPFALEINVYADNDQDASQDAAEQGSLQGVSLILGESNDVTRISDTDENGMVQFSSVHAGDYFIEYPDGQRILLSGNRFNHQVQIEIAPTFETLGAVAAAKTKPAMTATPESVPVMTITPVRMPDITPTLEVFPERADPPLTTPEITVTTETEPVITATSESVPEITATLETAPEITATLETVPKMTATTEATIPPQATTWPKFFIKVSSVNLRDGPDVVFDVIDYILEGEAVRIIARIQDDNPWYYVETEEGQLGWVYARDEIGELDNFAVDAIPTANPVVIPTPTS